MGHWRWNCHIVSTTIQIKLWARLNIVWQHYKMPFVKFQFLGTLVLNSMGWASLKVESNTKIGRIEVDEQRDRSGCHDIGIFRNLVLRYLHPECQRHPSGACFHFFQTGGASGCHNHGAVILWVRIWKMHRISKSARLNIWTCNWDLKQIHCKKKSTSEHLFLVLQVVTNRGLYSVPGRTK